MAARGWTHRRKLWWKIFFNAYREKFSALLFEKNPRCEFPSSHFSHSLTLGVKVRKLERKWRLMEKLINFSRTHLPDDFQLSCNFLLLYGGDFQLSIPILFYISRASKSLPQMHFHFHFLSRACSKFYCNFSARLETSSTLYNILIQKFINRDVVIFSNVLCFFFDFLNSNLMIFIQKFMSTVFFSVFKNVLDTQK